MGLCGFVWVCVGLCRFVWVCVGLLNVCSRADKKLFPGGVREMREDSVLLIECAKRCKGRLESVVLFRAKHVDKRDVPRWRVQLFVQYMKRAS